MKNRAPPSAARRRASAGFTLVELMVAMVLGLLLTAAVTSLFVANKRNYRRNNLVAEMQDNARFAMQALVGDLAMAGFLGAVSDPGRIELLAADMPPLPLTNDCTPGADGDSGWAFDTTALEFVDAAGGAAITATYGCLGAANLSLGSDVVSVHHASDLAGIRDANGATPALETTSFYLRSNRTTGALFFSGDPAADAAGAQAPLWYWRYSSHLYFVRPYSASPGDGIPTLCRAYIDHDAKEVAIERVAEGVQVLQIAFGIDSDGNGAADRYRVDPGADQLADAVTARITLLVRSIAADPSFANVKTYDLVGYDDDGDGSVDETGEGYTPDDHYYRRVLQTTVILRNVAPAMGVSP